MPTPRGAPVTIEPHMQNASTFPPASATRPRKVVQFRYARPESGILTTILFGLSGIAPARPLSGAKRYTRARPPPIGGKAVQAVKSLCTFQTSRRTLSGLHAIRGAPRVLYGGRCPCHLSGGCAPVLLTVPIIAVVHTTVNRFLEKIFGLFFSKIMKTHARVVVRKTGENRRKQGF